MADGIKSIDDVKELAKQLGYSKEKTDELVKGFEKFEESSTRATKKTKENFEQVSTSLTPIRDALTSAIALAEKLGGIAGKAAETFARLGLSIYNTTNATMSYEQHFKQAFAGTKIGDTIGALDEVTKMSKEFTSQAIRIGSEFGLGFEAAKRGAQSYTAAVMLAQDSTYQTREQIEAQTQRLAQLGIGLEDISKTFGVAGSQQNLLSVGFRLAQDSGLGEQRVLEMMATSMRKMGLSTEDAGRPLLALQSIAKTTGLPLTELSDRIFGLVEQNARFGTTVESLSPIVRRFTSVLGEGFKGFAIKDTEALIRGLGQQVNTTNAAFMAMQSGMARPGSGVASAMLDFEDALSKPESAMKMLASSLAGVSGGKILTKEDARASEAAAVQFKLQRDMLSQLTGINDPQQTKTLMALLADQQSGKQLSAEENRTLADAMNSGAKKQEEQKTLAEKIGKAQVGLLAQIALSVSTAATGMLTPGVESALIGGAAKEVAGPLGVGQNKIAEFIDNGIKITEKFLADASPGAAKLLSTAQKDIGKFIEDNKANISQSPERRIPGFAPNERALTVGGPLTRFDVEPTKPTPFAQGMIHTPNTSTAPLSSKEVTIPGEKEVQHLIVTFRGTDDLTKAIADAASKQYNKTLHGNG
jgi:hypothetical protein